MAGRKKQNAKPAVIAADLKHYEALRLRLAKFTLQEIADSLGYETPSGAKAAIAAAMLKVGILPTQEAVAAELADLHLLEESVMKAAAMGDFDSIKAVLDIKKMRAALQGLNAPSKVAVTDPSGEHPAPIIILPPVDGSLPPEVTALLQPPTQEKQNDTSQE
jgi:AraC-like DNA-binding protein